MSTPSPKPIAAGVLVALLAPLHPAYAQHAGHEGHASHAAVAKPRSAGSPAPAKKGSAAAQAAVRPAKQRDAKAKSSESNPAHARIHRAMGHEHADDAERASTDHSQMDHADHSAMDHSQMDHSGHPSTDHADADRSQEPAVDHSKMGQSQHSAVDHSKMDHSGHSATGHSKAGRTGMDHSDMDHSGMDHSGMDHSNTDQSASAPTDRSTSQHAGDHGMDHSAHAAAAPPRDLPPNAAPRTPIPVLTDADRAAATPVAHGHAAHDQRPHSFWLVDRLEWQDTGGDAVAWEGVAWVGGDVRRLWLRTEGEAAHGELQEAYVEALYGRSVTPWWDVVAGVRQDFGEGPSRTWAAVGVQGMAPYKFEVEATAYLGGAGRTAATVEAEYDTLITNRLILQWQAEATLYGRDDTAHGVASGLATVEAGARLRYEFSRRFAPYIGVQWERAFGGTADLRREDGHPVEDTRLVAGVRFWF